MFPIPYGEGGIHYRFAGAGWLAHDERADVLHLRHDDRELAAARSQGSRGWQFTEAGKKLLQDGGWSAAEPFSSGGSAYVIGSSEYRKLPGARFDHEIWVTQPNAYYHFDPPWKLLLAPEQPLNELYDSVVFLCDVSNRLYIRVAGFDSEKYSFQAARIVRREDHDDILYSLKERQTGKVVERTYLYDPWQMKGLPGAAGVSR